MARRRMIDPNFWRSQDVKKLTIRQRLLAIGLFSLADDYGRGIADPPYVRAVVFPYDDIPSIEIEEDLKAIEQRLSIKFYDVDGGKYYSWLNWEKWQRVDKRQNSILPPPPDENKSRNGSENGSENGDKNGDESNSKLEDENNSNPKRKEEKRSKEKGKEEEEEGKNASLLILSSTLPDHTETERQILAELKAVPGYPFNFEQDLDYIRTLTVEFPTLDLLAEAKKWRTYKRDKPLKPKSNARLQFRNWCEKAAQWQQEKGVKPDGQRDQHPGTDTGQAIDFDKFLWKGT